MRLRYLAAAGAVALGMTVAGWSASGSPVADAAMSGNMSALSALIQQKADVNAPQADGATAIQWAAYKNDAKMADVLIAAGANVKTPNRDGATALQLACLNGSAVMIGKLLKAGADPNELAPKGETPLMFAARNGNVDAIKVLLAAKADVNLKEKVRGTTALMWAAEQGHPEAVKVLADNGADVGATSAPDSKGARAYLAPTVQQRQASTQGAGGIGGANGGRGAAGAAPGAGRGGRGGGGRGAGRGPAAGAAGAEEEDAVAAADAQAAAFSFGRQTDTDGGGLTALVLAARENCLECAKVLIDAKADVNEVTHYGWSALLTATQNRHYKLASYLLEKGANPNIANKGGWTPLYLATDNRNIEGGDYPVRKPDMDHLEFIKLLIDKGANVNARVCGSTSTPTACSGDSTETRTNFTMQWLREDGATAFLRAAQSSDIELMKLLLAHGADPKIATANNDTALSVASGIGWVEGVTYEWSEAENLEAVKMCLDLGIDPNAADVEGRTALHGAAHKGRNDVIKMLVDRGAKLDARDKGSRDTVNGDMKGLTWEPLNYAQGLVRVGVQSAIAHPETAKLIKDMMVAKGLEIPPDITSSICLTKGVKGCQ
jgi:ankyrin repeat protein